MAVLADITDFSPRAARNSAARGVSVLLSGIPFYLNALDSYASRSVFLMQHDVRIPLPDSPVIEHLLYAVWLKVIWMRIHGHFMPPPAVFLSLPAPPALPSSSSRLSVRMVALSVTPSSSSYPSLAPIGRRPPRGPVASHRLGSWMSLISFADLRHRFLAARAASTRQRFSAERLGCFHVECLGMLGTGEI